jgi:hypothetical protein
VTVLEETPAHACGLDLRELFLRISDADFAPSIVVDFGETSRFGYYTGSMFRVLAKGPGEPLASGGRYDNLYPRFGVQRAAAGCALDVNNVCWALETANWSEPAFPRLVADATCDPALLVELRRRHVACAVTASNLVEYARCWGFDFTLQAGEPPVVSALAGPSATADGASVAERAAKVSDFISAHKHSGAGQSGGPPEGEAVD